MTTTPTQEKTFLSDAKVKLPRAFILRRLHSLLGVWLVIYLCEHLLVNSQAGLFFEDDGEGFISAVNRIHQLPYLPAIEFVFLALPFLIHGIWGVLYLRDAKYNSFQTDGSAPALPQYKRNHAFTWQRITSWMLVIGIIAHVIHMRFVDYPTLIHRGVKKTYFIRVTFDSGLYGIAHKLGAVLYDQKKLNEKQMLLEEEKAKLKNLDVDQRNYSIFKENVDEDEKWLRAALKKPLRTGDVAITTSNAGTAFLLVLRDVFKSPAMVILYSILVLAAVFHAFNGLWTFMISWGVTLTRRSQKKMRKITTIFMVLIALLGLTAAWGSYFSTLGQ